MSGKRHGNTRLEIIQIGLRLFLRQGYTETTVGQIAKEVGISKGNVTFHFPTKEHLLAELVKELCDFQWKLIEQYVEEGDRSLLAVCMELATMAVACESYGYARDFYLEAYRSPMSLEIIRVNDVEKSKAVYGAYCRDWGDDRFDIMQDIVSGIEYGVLATPCNQVVTMDKKVGVALDCIMKLYQVPEQERRIKIEKVLKMDYQAVGVNILHEFVKYVDEVNSRMLENSITV